MGDASASFTNMGEKEMQIMPKARLSLGFMHKSTYFISVVIVAIF